MEVKEKITPLPVVPKDLVYVPGFTNEEGLADLVNEIHRQVVDAHNGGEESGWDGGAIGVLFVSFLLGFGWC